MFVPCVPLQLWVKISSSDSSDSSDEDIFTADHAQIDNLSFEIGEDSDFGEPSIHTVGALLQIVECPSFERMWK